MLDIFVYVLTNVNILLLDGVLLNSICYVDAALDLLSSFGCFV